jgi:hypothetical protein
LLSVIAVVFLLALTVIPGSAAADLVEALTTSGFLMLQNSSAADPLQFFSAFYAPWFVLLAGHAPLFRFVSRLSYFVFFTHSSYALVPFFSRVLLHKEGRCYVEIFPLLLLGIV